MSEENDQIDSESTDEEDDQTDSEAEKNEVVAEDENDEDDKTTVVDLNAGEWKRAEYPEPSFLEKVLEGLTYLIVFVGALFLTGLLCLIFAVSTMIFWNLLISDIISGVDTINFFEAFGLNLLVNSVIPILPVIFYGFLWDEVGY